MTLDRTAEGMTSKFTSQFIIPRSPGGCVSISVSAACVPLVTTQSLHSSSQARLHHRGLHTGPLLLLVTALGLDKARCLLAGLVWPELVCAECQGYMRPLLLCCCNLVSWSPTDCSLRPEAAAESSQLLPPPAALQHSPHSCHELHSEAANPITHNLAMPSIGTKSETRQGKYNRLNYFYGCSCGGNYSERMPRCFGGSAVSAAGSAACPGRPGPPSLPTLVSFSHRRCEDIHYSLFTLHEPRRMM